MIWINPVRKNASFSITDNLDRDSSLTEESDPPKEKHHSLKTSTDEGMAIHLRVEFWNASDSIRSNLGLFSITIDLMDWFSQKHFDEMILNREGSHTVCWHWNVKCQLLKSTELDHQLRLFGDRTRLRLWSPNCVFPMQNANCNVFWLSRKRETEKANELINGKKCAQNYNTWVNPKNLGEKEGYWSEMTVQMVDAQTRKWINMAFEGRAISVTSKKGEKPKDRW
jgi:hypothetical protein